MSTTRQTILASRPAAMVLALSLVAGLSAPFVLLPPVRAAQSVPNGTTELSPAPVELTQAVPPNIVVTFDDSGSMASDFMGDNRPFDNRSWSSPWMCAGVIDAAASSGIGTRAMNGVYYNPNVTYAPPVNANGASFPNADSSLAAVWNDGIAVNRPLGGSSGTTDFTGKRTVTPNTGWYWNGTGQYTDWNQWVWGTYPAGSGYYSNNQSWDRPNSKSDTKNGSYPTTTTDNRWRCPKDSTSPLSDDGGPYYYRYTGPTINVDQFGNPSSSTDVTNLYTKANWTAVAVPASQYQNWANWWAYYHTRTLMARTAVSRAFGSSALAAKDSEGGFGSDIRVAWQELNDSSFKLPSSAIISAITDTANCTTTNASPKTTQQQSGTPRSAPDCYRTAFFNWIFSVGASGSTPARAAAIRAGDFFTRGSGNTGKTGDLHDPYWQPPQTGSFDANSNPGNELYCRQNFHMLVTDGYWNEANSYTTTGYALPNANTTLPDGTAYSASAAETRIYWDVRSTSAYTPSQADIGFNYWATNLRPDLYNAAKAEGIANPVPPYMPDSTTGIVTGAASTDLEKYFNPNNDPANWPHMVEYMVTLGVPGNLVHSEDYDCKNKPDDACSLRTGATTSDGGIGWPQPLNNNPAGIDDTWNAAVNSRGKYFNAGNPDDLVNQLSSILSNIAARATQPRPAAVNASVASAGALSFNVGHNADWSGVFQAVQLTSDGKAGNVEWDAGAKLDARAATDRTIYTATYTTPTGCGTGTYSFNAGAIFDTSTTFDCVETAGLSSPALPSTGNDTLANRVSYLRGDQSHESDGTYRKRTDLLGAIIHSQPVYVGYPTGNYYGFPSGSPEATAAAASTGADDKSYDSFVADHGDRAPVVYVGANDGMLHAFDAPVPTCTFSAGTPTCDYDPNGDAGKELWAFVPRAVYANLGNLTTATDFNFRPTVDASPVTRDVFFNSDSTWHTILAGGVGLGGRGVYALDITDPTKVTAKSVLWEFDSDMTMTSTCVSVVGTAQSGTCQSSDLGYTVSQPNIGRLSYYDGTIKGRWVVLVPNGYFPDCSANTIPTANKTVCQTISAQAPNASGYPYSALFVLDAQTGAVIAELKTPTTLNLKDGSGKVISFGLGTPVMGDYDSDQIDDVAFAGDLQGNLWKFDFRNSDPKQWKVTLVYQGNDDGSGTQGLQPITTMPRLFPDPATNSFIVVFGTGKYLGASDNGTTTTQALMGVRDNGVTYTQTDLTQQYMHESIAPATLPDGKTPNPNAGATLRCVTGGKDDTCDSATALNTIPSTGAGSGGWFVNLYVPASATDPTSLDQGERVVVSPGAIFASNTVVFETLLTGSSGNDPCNPSIQGAVLALNATTGGPANISALGGWPIAGGRVSNVRTSGSLPLVSSLGGGQAYLPGVMLAPSGKNPLSIDAPIWRRRSWQGIQQN